MSGLISSFQGQVEAINEASLDGIVLGQPVVPGCTYALATNFNPEANAEDGSCFFMGCTDPLALNHQLFATVENGTCEYPSAPEESCPSDIDGDGGHGAPICSCSWRRSANLAPNVSQPCASQGHHGADRQCGQRHAPARAFLPGMSLKANTPTNVAKTMTLKLSVGTTMLR